MPTLNIPKAMSYPEYTRHIDRTCYGDQTIIRGAYVAKSYLMSIAGYQEYLNTRNPRQRLHRTFSELQAMRAAVNQVLHQFGSTINDHWYYRNSKGWSYAHFSQEIYQTLAFDKTLRNSISCTLLERYGYTSRWTIRNGCAPHLLVHLPKAEASRADWW